MPEPRVGHVHHATALILESSLPLRFGAAQLSEFLVEDANLLERETTYGHVGGPDGFDPPFSVAEVELALTDGLLAAHPRQASLRPEPHGTPETTTVRIPLCTGDKLSKPLRWNVLVVIDQADRVAYRV